MRLLKTKCFLNLKQFTLKYNFGFSGTKQFSSVSVAGDEISSDSKQPEFIETRLKLWNKFKVEYDERLQAKSSESIKVQLPYGRQYEGLSWQSTPMQIFHEINKNSARKAIVARVDNELWDLNRPLETDCQVELLTFEDPLAKEVLWHSAAHILGSSLESIYGCLLNTGPPTNNGFFYDIFNNNKPVG